MPVKKLNKQKYFSRKSAGLKYFWGFDKKFKECVLLEKKFVKKNAD